MTIAALRLLGTGLPTPSGPLFVSAHAAVNQSGDATVQAPDSIVAGNLLLALGTNTAEGGDTIVLPAGFTQVFSATGDVALAIGWKIASGSEPSTYTFSDAGGNGFNGGAVLQYSTAAYDVHGTESTGNNGTWSTNAFTAGVAGSIAIAFGGTFDGVALEAPSGMTQRAGATDDAGISIYAFDISESSKSIPSFAGDLAGSDEWHAIAFTVVA